MKKLALLALVFGFAHASTPQAPSGVAASTSPLSLSVAGLHIVGNQILNSANQAVQLHGVDINGASYNCQSTAGTPTFDGPTTQASINAMLAWGINIVRIPTNEACWLGINGQPANGTTSTQYQSDIVNYIALLNSNNIAVIFDLQFSAPGTTTAQNNEPMPDADHSPAFWASVGGTTGIKNNASVIFNLFNEPWPDGNNDSTAAWSCVKNGGTCPGVSFTAASMQSLVNAIRGAGANNILLVPGVQYTNTLDQWLANEPTDTLSPAQIAADWHTYANQVCGLQTCWNSIIANVMASVPLIAGEIGETDCQDAFIPEQMDWLDAHGGNYLAWAWSIYDCSNFPAVISDYTGTPTSYGIGYRNHLLALTGQPQPTPPTVTFYTSSYPFGIWVGGSSNYTASDGTVYVGDTTISNSAFQIVDADPSNGNFVPYTTTDTITGTSDPTLFKTERWGHYIYYYINVPNGNYTVTLGAAPNSVHDLGAYGQDQLIQGTRVASCQWSSTPSNGSTGCGTGPVPTVDVALTVTYSIAVYNQQLVIEVGASTGGGLSTALSYFKVVKNAPATVPTNPSGLSGSASGGIVNLTWTASTGATYYKLLRATGTRGAYLPIGTPETNAYADSSVTTGTNYCFQLSALNQAGASGNTNQFCVTP